MIGIPFQCTFDLGKDQIYALAGESTVARFTDEELVKLLSGKLLVDGPAAAALCKRGFSKYLGLEAELTDFRFNREWHLQTGLRYGISKAAGVPRFTLLDSNAEVLTQLGYSPFNGSDEMESVAPATVFYRNALGGYVCSTAFHQDVPYAQYHEARNKWYLEILEKLNGGKLPVVCREQQEVITLTREYADGSILLYMSNLNFDDLDEIRLHCAKMPSEILRLTPEGNWEKAPFRTDDERIILEWHLGCYDTAVFKLC